MRFLQAIGILILLSASSLGQSVATITGPVESRAGDLTVLTAVSDPSNLTKWIIPEELAGRYLETGSQLAFAVREAGDLTFHLIVVDIDAKSIEVDRHVVTITDGLCDEPDEPGNPPEEPDDPDEPDPPADNVFRELSRSAAASLSDPTTAKALADAIESLPKSDIESMASVVRDSVDGVLNRRTGRSLTLPWFQRWREPVNQALRQVGTADEYHAALMGVASGLRDSLGGNVFDPPADDQPATKSVRMHTRDGCGWCDRWKDEVKPLVIALGFEVTEVVSTGAVPQFDITVGDKTTRLTGYQTEQSFAKFLSDLAAAVSSLRG